MAHTPWMYNITFRQIRQGQTGAHSLPAHEWSTGHSERRIWFLGGRVSRLLTVLCSVAAAFKAATQRPYAEPH